MITLQRTTCFILSALLASSCSIAGSGPPQRNVRVKVLADSKLVERDPRWRQGVGGLIEAASDYFEREFGIRFVTQKIDSWLPQVRSPSTESLLSLLKNDSALTDRDGSYDLVIGLTGDRVNVYSGRARVDRIGNCQQGLGNYLVSYLSAPFRYQGRYAEPTLDVVTLLHELGHIFGAEHVQDTTSIMHENFDYRSEFDKKNREIILKNKFCPFGK
ncbi:MAG: M12 family metallo-peptidase [Acidimicrobiia bacterium]